MQTLVELPELYILRFYKYFLKMGKDQDLLQAVKDQDMILINKIVSKNRQKSK